MLLSCTIKLSSDHLKQLWICCLSSIVDCNIFHATTFYAFYLDWTLLYPLVQLTITLSMAHGTHLYYCKCLLMLQQVYGRQYRLKKDTSASSTATTTAKHKFGTSLLSSTRVEATLQLMPRNIIPIVDFLRSRCRCCTRLWLSRRCM